MRIGFIKKLITVSVILPGLAMLTIGVPGFSAAQTLVAQAATHGYSHDGGNRGGSSLSLTFNDNFGGSTGGDQNNSGHGSNGNPWNGGPPGGNSSGTPPWGGGTPPVVDPTISSTVAITAISVANGTALGSVGLPATTTVTLSNASTTSLAVTWDGGTPAYNGSASGTYAFVGTFTSLPAGITNPNNVTSSVDVIVAPAAAPTSTYTVTIEKFIGGSMATASSASSDAFPMDSSWNAANLGGAGSGTFDLGTDDSYQATTAPMDASSSYMTNEDTSGVIVGANCASGDPFALTGYSTGTSLAAAESSTVSTTTPNFTDLASNEYVIVWNEACVAAPAVTVSSTVALPDINVANGTTLGSVGLPATTTVTLSDATTTSLGVTWDGGTPVYNGNASGTYIFSGTLTLPAGVTNPNYVTAAVNVIVALAPIPPPVLTITTVTLPDGTVGVAYDQFVSATSTNASDTLLWNITGLPSGLGYSTSTGEITGTPVATSTNVLDVTVTGANPSSTPAIADIDLNVDAPTPAPVVVSSTIAIPAISVANGTALGSVGLPATTTVTLSDATTTSLGVTWDGGTPVYNGTTADTYVFTGTLTLPEGITNPNNVTSTVSVIVAAPIGGGGGGTTPSSTYTVTIDKFIDGSMATASSAASDAFPMLSSWNAANLGGAGSGSYALGTVGFNSPNAYEAITSPMSASSSYATNEDTTGATVGANCATGDPYALAGYSTGTSLAAAMDSAMSTTSPNFTSLTSNENVIVWNVTCSIVTPTSTTGTLTVEKDTIGGNGTFTFTGNNGLGAFSITTASGTGSDTFTNVTPGTYAITETHVPKGWTQTDTSCSSVTVTAGGTDVCIITNTMNAKLGEIRGTKFIDKDGDGTLKDGDNERLAGVTIYLDLNHDGTLDPGDPSMVTNKLGEYHFSNLPAGTYIVREVEQPGWIETVPASGSYTIVLAAGQISKRDNFGDFKLGTISGMKFNDLNGNGRKDSNEPGIPGITINLTKVGTPTIVASTVTAANGTYSFTNLGPGTYQVREVEPTGWVETTQNPPNITILSGTVSKNDNFGNHLGPVAQNRGYGGYQWFNGYNFGFGRGNNH